MVKKVTQIEKEEAKEEKVNEEKVNEEKVNEEKVNEDPAAPEQAPPPPNVQQIIEAYPADREKARDLLLLSIVIELGKIANMMEWRNKRTQEEIDKNITLKP